MPGDERKAALHHFFAKVVDPLGFKFKPDAELADFLLEQEIKLEQTVGAPFCPCQGRTGERKHDMLVVCPCIPYHQRQFNAMRRCWCGLFVHKDVTDPSTLMQIPESEVGDVG
jgi:ferredoxin-thioredoxin reductase catalytic chain